MKANELMIGDWIRIDEPDKYAGATGQIQSLMYHREGDAAYFHVFIQGKFGFVSRDVCSDDIRPITLTQEILEKNGFVANRHIFPYPYYEYDNNKIKVGFAFPQGNKTSYKEPWVYIDSERVFIEHLPCIYVHQLQHALRLCGIEKEIVL